MFKKKERDIMAYFNGKEWVSSDTPYTPPKPKTTIKPDPSVLATQKMLQAAGYNPGPLDGINGPKTKAALDAYNAAQAEPAAPAKPATKPASTNKPTVAAPTGTNTGTGTNVGIVADVGTDMGAITRADLDNAIASNNAQWQSQFDTFSQSQEDAYAKAHADAQAVYDQQLADYQAEQQRLAEAQRASRVAALGKARDSALAGLDTEKASIDPYYYDKRNQAAAASDVGAKNFAEYMAGRGISGNAGAMPEIYRQSGLNSRIGALDQAQVAEKQDIERRRSGIESSYQSDVANANADIDAQTMQNYINQMQTVQAQRIADNAAKGLTSTGEQTLQGRTAQNSELERQAALVAQANYADIQVEINRRSALDPNDPLIPYLQAARQQKIRDQEASQAGAQSEAYDNALAMWKASGIASQSVADILGVPVGAKTADYDISQFNAQTGRINATKTSSGTSSTSSTGTTLSASSYDNYIKSNIDVNDKAAIESYLTQLYNSGVDSGIVDALAAKYGV
jgi:hypothetical protein